MLGRGCGWCYEGKKYKERGKKKRGCGKLWEKDGYRKSLRIHKYRMEERKKRGKVRRRREKKRDKEVHTMIKKMKI